VQGTSVADASRRILETRFVQMVGLIVIGLVVTSVVVAIGLPGNHAAPAPTFTPPVTDPFLRKVQEGGALATAFCREVATVHTSPSRTSAQWSRYLDIQVFLATDRRRPGRDPAFGAALAAAQRNAAKRGAYVTRCTRAGVPAG
jgi:hypothetical protein